MFDYKFKNKTTGEIIIVKFDDPDIEEKFDFYMSNKDYVLYVD